MRITTAIVSTLFAIVLFVVLVSGATLPPQLGWTCSVVVTLDVVLSVQLLRSRALNLSTIMLLGFAGSQALLATYLFPEDGVSTRYDFVGGIAILASLSSFFSIIILLFCDRRAAFSSRQWVLVLTAAFTITMAVTNPAVLARRPRLPAPTVEIGADGDGEKVTILRRSNGSVLIGLNGINPLGVLARFYASPFTVKCPTVLRAVSVFPGYAPSEETQVSLLNLHELSDATPNSTSKGSDADPRGRLSPDLPSLSIVVDRDKLFGKRGIYTNSTSRGRAWETDCRLEMIEGGSTDQTRAGIRIHGGISREKSFTQKHSFRLYFSRRRTDAIPLQLQRICPSHRCVLVLRAGSSDSWHISNDGLSPRALYIRDEFARRIHIAMGGHSAPGRFIHLFLNGHYWGVYNAVVRPNSAYTANRFGGREESWDVIKDGKAVDGDLAYWNRMVDLCKRAFEAETQEDQNRFFWELQGCDRNGEKKRNAPVYIDLSDYVDYLIANFYCNNMDWPNSNFVAFRERSTNSQGFRFAIWDCDRSLGLVHLSGWESQAIRKIAFDGVAAPFRYLQHCDGFRRLFDQRVKRHFGPVGALHVGDRCNSPLTLYVKIADEIESAMVDEAARWGGQEGMHFGMSDWKTERDRLKVFFRKRSEVVLRMFASAKLSNADATTRPCVRIDEDSLPLHSARRVH